MAMLETQDQREYRAGRTSRQAIGPGGPRRTSLNWGPEQIRRWSNPVPNPLGEGEGPQPDSPALTAGVGKPHPCQQENTANHSGLTLPPISTHSERRGYNQDPGRRPGPIFYRRGNAGLEGK